MIVSHKYKFIFIKTEKTAGTSIEVFLSQFCGNDDILTPIYPHVEPHAARNFRGFWNPVPEMFQDVKMLKSTLKQFLKLKKFYNHIPAWKIKNRLPTEIWDNYFKFCVERNPWDKTLSHYYMVKDRIGSLTIDQYINKGIFCFNYPKYTDAYGNLLVDKVIRYESLLNGLSEVFDLLEIPFKGTLGINAKSEHRKDRRHYEQIFSNEQKKLIEKVFAKEIKMFGYRF